MSPPTPRTAKPSVFEPDLEVTGDITGTGPLVVQACVVSNLTGEIVTIEHWANVKGDIEAKQARLKALFLAPSSRRMSALRIPVKSTAQFITPNWPWKLAR